MQRNYIEAARIIVFFENVAQFKCLGITNQNLTQEEIMR
jgi:hypothetical protein